MNQATILGVRRVVLYLLDTHVHRARSTIRGNRTNHGEAR